MTIIDFYTIGLNDVILWMPLVQALREQGADARFVIEPPRMNRAGANMFGKINLVITDESIETMVRILTNEGHTPLFRGRYDEADAVVTTNGAFIVDAYRGAKIRSPYGVGAHADSPAL